MSNNTQLPVEVVERIKKDAEVRATFRPNTTYHRGFKDGEIFGATAYATKLHEAQQAIETGKRNIDAMIAKGKEANDLLKDIMQATSDKLIYEKIKTFLHGE